MGTFFFGEVIVFAVFVGIVLLSLLTMAKRSDQIYARMLHGEEIASPANQSEQPVSEIMRLIGSGDAKPERDLSAPVAA
jgi:hypothetical protein